MRSDPISIPVISVPFELVESYYYDEYAEWQNRQELAKDWEESFAEPEYYGWADNEN